MRTTTSWHLGRRLFIALLAAFSSVAGLMRLAEANCRPLPDCDPLNPHCVVCDPSIGDFHGDNSSHELVPQTSRSIGADLGRVFLDAVYPNMSHASLPTPPAQSSNADAEAYEQVRTFVDGLNLEERARSGRASLDRVADALNYVGGSGRVPVPRAQGVDRDINPSCAASTTFSL
jgi:hypothetical protein